MKVLVKNYQPVILVIETDKTSRYICLPFISREIKYKDTARVKILSSKGEIFNKMLPNNISMTVCSDKISLDETVVEKFQDDTWSLTLMIAAVILCLVLLKYKMN
jgi:hypothetical protein